MSYLGDIPLGATLDGKFTTRRFSTGAPFTLAGTPAVAAYPDNSTTEITAGITLTVDFDGRTGLNNVRVVATSGNGYLAATNYALVITAGTVDGVSVVGEVIGHVSIGARTISGIRNNAALNNFEFEMIDSADHFSPKTGLTITAERSIDGGAYAACANAAAEVGVGTYKINLATTDLNGDLVTFKFTAAGADQTKIEVKTTP